MSRHHRRVTCPLCGGVGSVSISRGIKAQILAKCFRCCAPFAALAAALGLPLEKTDRRRPPPRRGSPIDIAIAELVIELDLRREKLLAKLPSVDWLEMNGQARHEANEARFLRKLASACGPTTMGWDFAWEAAQRETRARLIVCELDRQLERMNPTRRALEEVTMTTEGR